MSERLERRIRELCGEIRREDEANAPAFSSTLAAALEHRPRGRPRELVRRWAPVAAAAMLLLAVALAWFAGGDRPEDPLAGADIVEWVAPSTRFLQLEDAGLFEPVLYSEALPEEPLESVDSSADELLPSDILLYDAEWALQEEAGL